MITATRTAASVAHELGFERLFDDNAMHFDLRGGVIINPAKSRVCLLTTDLLTGVYRGLKDEAGGAWKSILKKCGELWGQRVAHRLDRECQLVFEQSAADLPVERYLTFITEYFAFHGWGRMTLDFSQAQARGIVQGTLEDSAFATAIDDQEEMVDSMIAGMLGSMLSYLSQNDLDSVQTACSTKGAPHSRFILTSRRRLEKTEQMVKLGHTHEELLQSV